MNFEHDPWFREWRMLEREIRRIRRREAVYTAILYVMIAAAIVAATWVLL